MLKIFKNIFDNETKELKKFNAIAEKIDALDPEYTKMTDKQLAAKTDEFKKRLASGETLEDILVEAFATIREVAYRLIGEKAYFVQLLGGLAIHYGNIAEMKTGEGKTLTTIFPAYLNALTGEGVHVVTVNEYLTQRNAEWMGPIFNFLGLTVGVNLRSLSPQEKQEVYNSDITYTTNNEVGFDYLRDNMVVRKEDRVLRPLNYCIIDEVDSILIDEARTPLIISGGVMQNVNLYEQADMFAKSLKENEDYIKDEKTRTISLTDEGAHRCERIFKIDNLYDINNTALVHHINLALKANYFMHKDVDYVVQEGEVIIVDQFTGRLMPGRAFSEGLHQAIEAKERVKVNEETKTLATITFQNLFRMYKKLSGMTGTAKTEEEEFRNIYNMYVIEIPTNKEVIREDYPDLVYATSNGKYKAIINYITEVHKTGEPILIGTISVEANEYLSSLLRKAGLKHEVLNAKNHEREAEIIAKAGEIGSITLATNMAGRGTDIKLGEGVKELGGLCVVGTERHESRRIDNQLRGRAGRQGDPGKSQFFVSFEDDLMKRFGTERIKMMLTSLGIDETQAIRSKALTRSIETAQKKVEGNNYDIRKTLLDYDNVLNEQREIIYNRRNEILDQDSIHDSILEVFKNTITSLVESHYDDNNKISDECIKELVEYLNANYLKNNALKVKDLEGLKKEEIIDKIFKLINKDYEKKMIEAPVMNEFEKAISLRIIDSNWVDHMSAMEHLKEGIGLRGYSQTSPIQAYTMEGFELFDNLLLKIEEQTSQFLLKAEVRQNTERKQTLNGVANDGKETVKSAPKRNSNKIGRNDPCPCGSGKKYKQCCGR